MKSFLAYQALGTPQLLRLPYARDKPLECNAVKFDDFGTFDTVNFCYVAPYPQRMLFHANHLWEALPDGYAVASHLMLNQLGTATGGPGGEFAGYDRTVHQKYAIVPESVDITRPIDLMTGDKVWSVATLTLGANGKLTGSVAGNGQITANYFTGIELRAL